VGEPLGLVVLAVGVAIGWPMTHAASFAPRRMTGKAANCCGAKLAALPATFSARKSWAV
jgi:hypothetical protein